MSAKQCHKEKKTEERNVAYMVRKGGNMWAILVDNPAGLEGSGRTAFVKNQSFLAPNHLSVLPTFDFTVLTGRLPVSCLCRPVRTTAF